MKIKRMKIFLPLTITVLILIFGKGIYCFFNFASGFCAGRMLDKGIYTCESIEIIFFISRRTGEDSFAINLRTLNNFL